MISTLKRGVLSIAALVISAIGALTWSLTARRLWAQCIRFLGNLGLKLFPSIWAAADARNVEYASGKRKKSYLEKHRFVSTLHDADAQGLSAEQVLEAVGVSRDDSQLSSSFVQQMFRAIAPDAREVAVHYSGGADSTLAAFLAAEYFDRVHLLTFYHEFVAEGEKSRVNARKLAAIFGADRIQHVYVDVSETLKAMLFGDFWDDLKQYGMFPAGTGCLSCKLTFDIHSVEYALEHNIPLVIDGSDLRVEFQLSQGNEELLEERRRFYLQHGIEFAHPAAEIDDSDVELLLRGLNADPPQIMYGEQPHCKGYDFLAEIYERYWFLPKHGIHRLTEIGLKYTQDKLALGSRLLADRALIH